MRPKKKGMVAYAVDDDGSRKAGEVIREFDPRRPLVVHTLSRVYHRDVRPGSARPSKEARTMNDKPMTKAEARAFLKRARDGIRWAEQALREGDADNLHEALGEVGGAAAHVQNAMGDHENGINGVAWTGPR